MQKYFALIILFVLPVSVYAFAVPIQPTGYVNDYAVMLSKDQVSTLEAKLVAFEKATTDEMAVVTIPSLDGDTIENVAQEIFTKWEIGKKDKNNGVLLLVSLEDRETRIHTGYGVEGDLTDIGTSYIQREVIAPSFQNGDYAGGINGAVDKMIEALGGNDIVPEGYEASSKTSSIPWNFILVGSFVFLQFLGAVLAQSKSWWGGGVVGGFIGGIVWYFFIKSSLFGLPVFVILILFGLLFDFIVSKAQTQKGISGRYPWWFGGGTGGGFGGGGFGGFGGGMSGGGGSSGRW